MHREPVIYRDTIGNATAEATISEGANRYSYLYDPHDSYTFVIAVRKDGGTTLSKELQELARSGEIIISERIAVSAGASAGRRSAQVE